MWRSQQQVTSFTSFVIKSHLSQLLTSVASLPREASHMLQHIATGMTTYCHRICSKAMLGPSLAVYLLSLNKKMTPTCGHICQLVETQGLPQLIRLLKCEKGDLEVRE